jgi:hypothetical protein
MFDFRITAGQAQTQGKITGLTVTLDAPDISRDARQRGDLLGRHAPRAGEELRHGEERAPHHRQRRRHAVSATQEDTQATGPLVKTRDGTRGRGRHGHVNARIEG